MKTERVQDLLRYALLTAAREENPYARALGPIHLLKYLYLSDMIWASKSGGETFTSVAWRFHHFGPYAEEALDPISALAMDEFVSTIAVDHARAENEGVRYRIRADADLRRELEDRLPLLSRRTLKEYVHLFTNDTSALLHHVYATPPMLRAAPGARLLFEPAGPDYEAGEPDVSPSTLTEKQRKRRREGLAARKAVSAAALSEAMAATMAPSVGRPPRYDDLYFEGSRWLDELAGEPPPGGDITVTVDDTIWLSPNRTRTDVP